MSKSLPILFNTEMVKAILEGRKTVTRRVIKDPYYIDDEEVCRTMGFAMHKGTDVTHGMPYQSEPCRRGDILYVRETWGLYHQEPNFYVYKADSTPGDEFDRDLSWKWRPSIHMPKCAARIFLRVKKVRVERLWESLNATVTAILEIQAEGMDIGDTCMECLEAYTWPCCVEAIDDDGSTIGECGMLDTIRGEFSDLWDSTIKPSDLENYGWAANPWVWVISFERCEKPEGWPM